MYVREFESRSGDVYSIQHYMIKFVSDLPQVCCFFRVLWFPPAIKLIATPWMEWSSLTFYTITEHYNLTSSNLMLTSSIYTICIVTLPKAISPFLIRKLPRKVNSLEVIFQLYCDSKILLNCPPQERPQRGNQKQ
jgi:hypothetical protein